MTTSQQWLRTPMAAMAQVCSQNHLKRCRDSQGGFLVHGEHYINGASHSAPIVWNVEAIRTAFTYHGMLRQRGEAALKQAVGA